MRIVFTADTHIGLDHPQHPRTNRRRRGPDFLANLQTVLNHAVGTKADLLLHGGDVFDVPDVPDALIDDVYMRLVAVAEQGVPVAVIGGNHERAVLPSSLLARHRMLHVFHTAGVRVFPTRSGTVAVIGVPFVRGDVRDLPSRVMENVTLPDADVRLMLLHQAVEGATVGPQNYVFRQRADVVSTTGIPPGLDAVLSGHIHRAQVLWAVAGGKRVPVIYPGSVERTSFAEDGEQKSFVELRIENGQRWLKRHPLPARPLATVDVTGNHRQEVARVLAEQAQTLPEDAVVRIAGAGHCLALLNRALIDDVFPATMSVHWAPPRGSGM